MESINRHDKNYGEIPLTAYARGYFAASQRTRWVLIIITIASILAFFSFWNSSEKSWIDLRLTEGKLARQLILTGRLPDGISTNKPRQDIEEGCREWLRHNHFILGDEAGPLEVEPMIHRVWADSGLPRPSALTGLGLGSHGDRPGGLVLTTEDHAPGRLRLEALERYIEHLERLRLEEVVFLDVPFLGIYFDVNDLGLVSGIALSLLLIMLAFSTRRELEAARACFSISWQRGRMADMYELLSMAEVISQPSRHRRAAVKPSDSGENAINAVDTICRQPHERGVWRWVGTLVPLSMTLLPVVIHAVIVVNDHGTIAPANVYPDKNVEPQWYAELFLLLAMAGIASLALRQLLVKKALWASIHRLIAAGGDEKARG